ncbi:MAG TPA: NAD(P)H-dependent glycerol-3-phosphate dehydrogenase, partial [Candidatus Limnocylindrales bacterium]
GTTLAAILAQREPVVLVCHSPETAARIRKDRRNEARLPGIDLPAGIRATHELSALAEATDLIVFAVPSAHLRSTASEAAPHIPPSADLLSVVKGIERGTHLRMTDVIAEAGAIDRRRIAALSGPNLALEIARRLPASAVVAADDVDLAARIQERLGRRRFRLYVNRDVLGVELCGALKNVVAIAAGAAEELGFGDNGKAGLMTRGVAEMTRLGIAAGANPLTFAGLAGIGDVIATCGSSLSRNHRLGVELAKGRTWAEIEATLPGVAEGAYTVDAALALADELGVEMPIAREVHRALFEGKSAKRCLIDLLARESKDELADYDRWAARLATEPSPSTRGR